jgi:hypothetical protein
MNKIAIPIIALIIGGIIGFNFRGNAATEPQKSASEEMSTSSDEPKKDSKEWKIENAMSAAPESVSNDATILDWPEKEGGDLVELKKGTNDWTCLPDTPTSPGNDPICVDKQAMQWFQAYMTQSSPDLSQSGIAYMLQGGSDASNTDPFATKPAEGEDWLNAPAHIMVLPAGKLDQGIYGTDPKQGGSWIMWAGTPYEHLMIPVK